jgi:protocatechuate 3,4-dioxygenase beta subunit
VRLLAWLVAVSVASVASPQPGGTVSGRVVSALRGDPIAGAQVTLRGMEAPHGATPQTYIVRTGADGRFSANGIAPGVYDLRPSKLGYEARPPERFATARDFPPFIIEDGSAVEGIELRLTPDGVIAGHALDSDGDPVRNATVEALQYRFARGKKELTSAKQTQSDDHGEYRLFNLPPGRYYLRAVHPMSACSPFVFGNANFMGMICNGGPIALGPAFYPAAADVSHASELNVTPGLEINGIDVRLNVRALYSVRGKFEGGRIAGHRITLEFLDEQGQQGAYESEITDDGFAFKQVPPGSYRLVADLVSETSAEEHVFAAQPIEIVNHDVETSLVFRRGYKVTTEIQWDSGASIAQAGPTAVRFIPMERGIEFRGEIDAAGALLPITLAPGVYRVAIDGPAAYLKAIRAGGKELAGNTFDPANLAGPLTILAGAERGRIEGTVIDESGKPVYNADVTILRDGDDDWSNRFKAVFTKSDGRFAFTGLVPGEYNAYAWLGAPPGEPQNPEFRKPYKSRAVAIDVKSGGAQSVQLKVVVVTR